MDGTLVDSELLWDVSLAELARRLGGELSARTRARMIGGSLPRTIRLMFEEVGRRPDPRDMAEATSWIVERNARLFAEQADWMPGALAIVSEVRSAGLPMALVTSTSRALTHVVLARMGEPYFDVVVCGDEVARPKPAPHPYRQAAAMLGVSAGDCVAVEDSMSGVASARAAGCVVLAVPDRQSLPDAPRQVQRRGLVGLTVGEIRSVWSDLSR